MSTKSTFIPPSIGEVRGPFYSFDCATYQVYGPGGWVGFYGPNTETSHIEKRARKFAAALLRIQRREIYIPGDHYWKPERIKPSQFNRDVQTGTRIAGCHRPSGTRTGTAHFLDRYAAYRYYRQQEGLTVQQVDRKFKDGAIFIGRPKTDKNCSVDNGGRYWIID